MFKDQVARLVLLTLAAGCAAGSASDRQASVLEGVIAEWQGGRAAVAAQGSSPTGPVMLAQGEVGESGEFRLELPPVLEPDLLVPLRSSLPCAQLTVVPEVLTGTVLSSLQLHQEGVPVGSIAQASSQAAAFPWPQQQGNNRVFRWYAAQEGRIEGFCPGQVGQQWSLQLKEGWNVVLETVVELTEASATIRYTVAPEAAAAPWFSLDAIMPPAP